MNSSFPMILSLAAIALTACTPREQDTPGYQAACEGLPLGTAERRNAALEAGYAIDARYDCIDKASYAAVAKARAEWKAANPERSGEFRKAGSTSTP